MTTPDLPESTGLPTVTAACPVAGCATFPCEHVERVEYRSLPPSEPCLRCQRCAGCHAPDGDCPVPNSSCVTGRCPQGPTDTAAQRPPAWWSTKPDDNDIILMQVRAWASMATLSSHVEVRPCDGSDGTPGWGAFIVRDVPCHHCGSLPDEDGDHSCPCPNPDGGCSEHE